MELTSNFKFSIFSLFILIISVLFFLKNNINTALGWVLWLPSFLLLVSSFILGIISIVKCIKSYRRSKTKINNLSLGISYLKHHWTNNFNITFYRIIFLLCPCLLKTTRTYFPSNEAFEN